MEKLTDDIAEWVHWDEVEETGSLLQSVILYTSLLLLALGMLVYYTYLDAEDVNSGKSSPNYGVAARPIQYLLIRITFLVSFFNLLFGMVYLPWCSGDKEYLCNSFLNSSGWITSGVLGFFLTGFLLRNFIGPLVRWRYNAALSPRPSDHIVTMGVYRGTAAVTAMQLLGPGGRVTVCDPHNTEFMPMSSAWCRENLRRAGFDSSVGGSVTVMSVDGRKTGLPDSCADIVLSNLADFLYPSMTHDNLAVEMMRILKPEGRLIVVSSLFESPIGDQLVRAGMAPTSRYFLPSLPLFMLISEYKFVAKDEHRDDVSLLHSVQKHRGGSQSLLVKYPAFPPPESSNKVAGRRVNHTPLLPILLFITSTTVLVCIGYAYFYFWPLLNKPVSVIWYNRIGAGYGTSVVLWFGVAMIAIFREQWELYYEDDHPEWLPVVKSYLMWITISAAGDIIVNLILYIPSLVADLLVSQSYQTAVTMTCLFIAFFLGWKLSIYFRDREAKKDFLAKLKKFKGEQELLSGSESEIGQFVV